MKDKTRYLILLFAAIFMFLILPGIAFSDLGPDVDDDGDGYTENQNDCDDDNPAINPGATEVCNFTDDDCDGIADGGHDDDGDFYGSVCDNCPNNYNPFQEESDGSSKDMRGYWKFEEGQGFVTYDTVKVNNGTINNAEWKDGILKNSRALVFKGAQRSDVTIVDESGNLSIVAPKCAPTDPPTNCVGVDGITIEVWVYGDESVDHYAPEWATIGIKSSYGCEQWTNIDGQWTCIDTDGDGINYHWYDDGYGLFYQPSTIPGEGHMAFFINHYNDHKAYSKSGHVPGGFTQGDWHHVAGTYDGEYIRIYVDGIEGTPHKYEKQIVDAWVIGNYLISGT